MGRSLKLILYLTLAACFSGHCYQPVDPEYDYYDIFLGTCSNITSRPVTPETALINVYRTDQPIQFIIAKVIDAETGIQPRKLQPDVDLYPNRRSYPINSKLWHCLPRKMPESQTNYGLFQKRINKETTYGLHGLTPGRKYNITIGVGIYSAPNFFPYPVFPTECALHASTAKNPGQLTNETCHPRNCSFIWNPNLEEEAENIVLQYLIIILTENANELPENYQQSRFNRSRILEYLCDFNEYKWREEKIHVILKNTDTNSTLHVCNLVPNNKYYYAVMLAYGSNKTSLDVSFYHLTSGVARTPVGSPSEPLRLSLDDRNRANVSLAWMEPFDLGGDPDPVTYEIFYRKISFYQTGMEQNDFGWNTIFTKDPIWAIPRNLTCATCQVEMKIRAHNKASAPGPFSSNIILGQDPAIEESERIRNLIIGSVIGIVIIVAVTGMGAFLVIRRFRNRIIRPPAELEDIPRVKLNKIIIREEIGRGSHGIVYDGWVSGLRPRFAMDQNSPNHETAINHRNIRVIELPKNETSAQQKRKMKEVALKTLPKGATAMEQAELIQEAVIMRDLNHKNILQLLGLCTEMGQFWLVTEKMNGGDLLSALHDTDKIMAQKPDASDQAAYFKSHTSLQLIKQILAGCCYLEETNILHRDLAARNCLVSTKILSEASVKISDFGLTRNCESDKIYYRLSRDSVFSPRWTAPEVYGKQEFLPKSDVWSFGVVMWEIISFGEHPFGDIDDERKVMEHVVKGNLLVKPSDCPPPIYESMKLCWEYTPEKRSSFSHLSFLFQS